MKAAKSTSGKDLGMFNRILIITPDEQRLELIKHGVADVSSAVPLVALDCAQAEARAIPLPDLIVADVNLPADENSALDRAACLGLQLLEKWHFAGKRPWSILLSDVDGTKVETRALKIDHCELLEIRGVTTDIAEGVRARASRLLRRSNARTVNRRVPAKSSSPPIAIIDLHLHPDKGIVTYRVERHEPGRPPEPGNQQFERVDIAELKQLVEVSRALDINGKWHLNLQNIGGQLFKQILTGDFRDDYNKALGFCRDPRNLRLRLTAERAFYPLAFEALYDRSRPDFLMLEAAIARRVPVERIDGRFGTSAGQPVNILVIVSNVGPADQVIGPTDESWKAYWEKSGQPEELQNIQDEREYFESLARRAADLGLGKVKVLSGPCDDTAADWSLEQLVRRELAGPAGGNGRPRYDIVHFAGHSCFCDPSKDDDDRGFLLFAGSEEATAVTVSTFASWLKNAGVRFVYMSSCKSSAAEVAFEMARAGIPAVLGFQWDLDDQKAVEFAITFHNRLLGALYERKTKELCPAERKLCFAEAFTSTRRELRDRHKKAHCIWAAPILIMQTDDWHRAHVLEASGGEELLAKEDA